MSNNSEIFLEVKMKSQILLFFVVFVFVSTITAQPGRAELNPFNQGTSCYFPRIKADFVVYGEVKSLIRQSLLKGSEKFDTSNIVTITPKKTFSGNPPRDEFELNVSLYLNSVSWDKHSRHIFFVRKEKNAEGKEFWYANEVSEPLGNLSDRALNIAFSLVNNGFKGTTTNTFEGAIAAYNRQTVVNYSEEDSVQFHSGKLKTKRLPNANIVLTNFETKKSYRTKSDSEAYYKFDDIPNGQYEVTVNANGKRYKSYVFGIDDRYCMRTGYFRFEDETK